MRRRRSRSKRMRGRMGRMKRRRRRSSSSSESKHRLIQLPQEGRMQGVHLVDWSQQLCGGCGLGANIHFEMSDFGSGKCQWMESVSGWKVSVCGKCLCVESVCVWKVSVCGKCLWMESVCV